MLLQLWWSWMESPVISDWCGFSPIAKVDKHVHMCGLSSCWQTNPWQIGSSELLALELSILNLCRNVGSPRKWQTKYEAVSHTQYIMMAYASAIVIDIDDSNQQILSYIVLICREVLLVLNLYSAVYISWNWCLCSKFIDRIEGENNNKKGISNWMDQEWCILIRFSRFMLYLIYDDKPSTGT